MAATELLDPKAAVIEALGEVCAKRPLSKQCIEAKRSGRWLDAAELLLGSLTTCKEGQMLLSRYGFALIAQAVGAYLNGQVSEGPMIDLTHMPAIENAILNAQKRRCNKGGVFLLCCGVLLLFVAVIHMCGLCGHQHMLMS